MKPYLPEGAISQAAFTIKYYSIPNTVDSLAESGSIGGAAGL